MIAPSAESLRKLSASDGWWLSGILLGLAALFLSLGWKHAGQLDRLLVDALFYAGIGRILWLKRERLVLDAGVISTVLGLALVLFAVGRSLREFWIEAVFLKVAPLVAFFGVALMASGFRGLRQYGREAVVLGLMVFFMSAFWPRLEGVVWFDHLTAFLAAFHLHYLGMEVAQSGAELALPSGAVRVSPACTGLPMTLLLLKLALLFVLVVPLRAWQRVGVPLAAIALGIFLGSVRVAVMAVSVSDRARFEFWHGDPGTEVFSTLAIVLMYLFCRWAARAQRWTGAPA